MPLALFFLVIENECDDCVAGSIHRRCACVIEAIVIEITEKHKKTRSNRRFGVLASPRHDMRLAYRINWIDSRLTIHCICVCVGRERMTLANFHAHSIVHRPCPWLRFHFRFIRAFWHRQFTFMRSSVTTSFPLPDVHHSHEWHDVHRLVGRIESSHERKNRDIQLHNGEKRRANIECRICCDCDSSIVWTHTAKCCERLWGNCANCCRLPCITKSEMRILRKILWSQFQEVPVYTKNIYYLSQYGDVRTSKVPIYAIFPGRNRDFWALKVFVLSFQKILSRR